MGVRWTRTALIANGKFMEAVAWSKEVSGYIESKWSSPPLSTWVDAFGQVGTIRWSLDFTDLSAVEKIQGQMLTDAGYWQLVDQAYKKGLFVDGSGNDVISRQV